MAVRGSVAIELEWLLHSALRKAWRDDHPVLRAVYDDHPGLLAEVTGLWPAEGRGGCQQFTELVLVAHHGGLLFTDDAGLLLDRLPGLCATVPTGAREFPMKVETPEDRQIALQRLKLLRGSAETRDRYVQVVSRVWAAASESWERFGRAAVSEAVEAKRRMLAKGASWRDLVTQDGCDPGHNAERVIAELGTGGELVLVPAYFAHVYLLYDLPGFVLMGVKADDTGAEARARTESLARRLRAISDPTRLAILDSLRRGPRTVTELSTRFGLAQPTVSNHVKLLRDSGILADVRDGAKRNLVVRHEVVEDLLLGLSHVLGDANGPRDHEPV